MNKTEHYQLNQWDPEDKVIRTDFNEDNAKLDAVLASKADVSTVSALQTTVAGKVDASALSALQTTVAGKVDGSALSALQTAIDSKGNCTVVAGTYIGTGTYGSSNPKTLSFGFAPKVVLVSGGIYAGMFVHGATRATSIHPLSGGELEVTWTSTGLSWYGYSELKQLNASGYTYYYVAFR